MSMINVGVKILNDGVHSEGQCRFSVDLKMSVLIK